VQYLGGKSRLAKYLVPIIAEASKGGPWWDPFCGGLSISTALYKRLGPGLSSDLCLPLISLYQAVSEGWDPPSSLSPEEYTRARVLPDTDPLKAFAGFGTSFAGTWFAGYARGEGSYAKRARNALLRDVPGLCFDHMSFFDIDPYPHDGVIYCDPPYRDTQGYGGVVSFDHERFYTQCVLWSSLGTPVFVSEYQVDRSGWIEVWSREYKASITAGVNGAGKTRVDRLYRVTT
jgi:DNA adenine methylase